MNAGEFGVAIVQRGLTADLTLTPALSVIPAQSLPS